MDRIQGRGDILTGNLLQNVDLKDRKIVWDNIKMFVDEVQCKKGRFKTFMRLMLN
jgi:hypothetical protein